MKKYVFGVTIGKFLGFMLSEWGIGVDPDKINVILEMTPFKIKRR